MGNVCGKASEVRHASSSRSALQPSLQTGSSQKAEARSISVKKEQREEKNKVHWSIPAEPSAKEVSEAQLDAQEAVPTVEETAHGQP